MSGIKIYSRWGDPRKQAALDGHIEAAKGLGSQPDSAPHGLAPEQIEGLGTKVAAKVPDYQNIVGNRTAIEQLLPDGATLDPRLRKKGHRVTGQLFTPGGVAGMGGGNSASIISAMRPYQPEFESPDRQMFPIHRRLANSYWRLFYKMDPVIGSVVDLFADLPWSDFQLTGEGVDGEVKDAFEAMCEETKLRSILPHLVREWMVVGEVIPHLFFDDDKGVWTHVTLHNPDQVNVVYSPFIKMDTIMEFVPDTKLRELVTSTHPMVARVREAMPRELVSRLQAGENVPLSPINATFIPRKLHWYDLRGTSVMTRLWRTFMLEDAIWSATIQTARRAAAPVKVVKLGDPATNTIPDPSEERRVLSMLAQAELDPQAWVVYNNQISFELAGQPDRVMSINQHYDLIERIKLVALGVSKSFVSGETTYSSAASGLTVFLQRLQAIRDYFVSEWLIPKFFLPVAMINGWIKPDKAKSGGGQLRVKRSAKEMLDHRMYIVPTIEWKKSLDPTIDKERIDAMIALENQLNIKISAQKKYAAMGLAPEEEWKQIVEETKTKIDIAGKDPVLSAAIGLGGGEGEGGLGGGGGGLGGILSPGIPPGAMGLDEGGGGPPMDLGPPGEGGPPMDLGGPGEGGEGAPPPSPEGASKDADAGSKTKPPDRVPEKSPRYWAERTLTPIVRLFRGEEPKDIDELQEEPWDTLARSREVQTAIKQQDPEMLWLALEQWLIDENYPSAAIIDLRDNLAAQNIIRKAGAHDDSRLEAMMAYLGVEADDFVPSKRSKPGV